MNKIKAHNIQIETVDYNGRSAQLNQLVEEAAELIHAVMKYKRYGSRVHLINLISELADVKNMIEQMDIVFKEELENYEEILDHEYRNKLERQDKRNLDKELNDYVEDGGYNPNLKYKFKNKE